MCFYQRESLPGYSAIFRHPNDELNYCYYLIPCGKDGMCGDVTARPSRPSKTLQTLMKAELLLLPHPLRQGRHVRRCDGAPPRLLKNPDIWMCWLFRHDVLLGHNHTKQAQSSCCLGC